MNLEATLRARRDDGHKLLVPYVTGGLGRGWLDVVRAVADAGADAIEVGIPFSDPVMDGRTIQVERYRAIAAIRPNQTPFTARKTVRRAQPTHVRATHDPILLNRVAGP